MLDELGVGKFLVNALEFPETNPEELKLLKGSKAAYKINTKRKKKQKKRVLFEVENLQRRPLC